MATTAARRRRQAGNGSRLLNERENAALLDMLGHNNVVSPDDGDAIQGRESFQSIVAGVVQLIAAEPPNPCAWVLKDMGVVALVKDYSQRAYFIRLYDFGRGKLWEQMLYECFQARQHEVLLMFEGDECVFGLNFSAEDEASEFQRHLNKRYETDTRRKTRAQIDSIPQPPPPADAAADSNVAEPTHTNFTSIFTAANWTRRKSKEKKPLISKDQISRPFDFVHKAHVGFEPDAQSAATAGDLDDTTKRLLKTVTGHDFDQLSRRHRAAVYQLVEQYGGVDQLRHELIREEEQLQPFPGSNDSHTGTPRPAASRPATSGKPACPPPPPPLPTHWRGGADLPVLQGSGCGDDRPHMLDQIRGGATLKHVDSDAAACNSGDVKPAEQMGGIAGALARALAERREQMNASDDSSDDAQDDERDDDEWED